MISFTVFLSRSLSLSLPLLDIELAFGLFPSFNHIPTPPIHLLFLIEISTSKEPVVSWLLSRSRWSAPPRAVYYTKVGQTGSVQASKLAFIVVLVVVRSALFASRSLTLSTPTTRLYLYVTSTFSSSLDLAIAIASSPVLNFEHT